MTPPILHPYQQLGLTRHPFPSAPDAEGYFHTRALEQRLSEAAHCLITRKGFVLLTGEVGMGKSTFLRRLLDDLQRGHAVSVAIVLNTFLQGHELLSAILLDFGLTPSCSTQACIELLNSHLLDCHQRDITCILAIDDAQNLHPDSLELIRLLSNLETGQEKLLQILLCGQPELLDTLARPDMRQLASRIVEHLPLRALQRDELEHYVGFRLAVSGAAGRIRLSPGALRTLHRHTDGNPRRAHLLLDRCLYGLLTRQNGLIDSALIKQAATEAGVRHARCARDAAAPAPLHTRSRAWMGPACLVVAGLVAVAAAWEYSERARSHPAATVTALAAPEAAATVAPASMLAAQKTALEAMALPTPALLSRECHALSLPAAQTAQHPPQILWTLPAELDLTALRQRPDLCLLPEGSLARALWLGDMASESFLQSGAQDDVRRAQIRLAALGLYNHTPDGKFGQRTRQALQLFQSTQGLPASGVPDTLTLMLLTGAWPDTTQPPVLIEDETPAAYPSVDAPASLSIAAHDHQP